MNTFKPPKEEEDRTAKTETKAETKTKLDEHIEKRAKLILLDLLMPNGKALRDCTGTDCRKFGGWFSRIADRVGSKKVGDVLSEKEVRGRRK
jgi:hypothetical protein